VSKAKEAADRRLIKRVITPISILAMVVHSGIHRRGQHPKQHGCVRATFQVLDNIPTRYKVGLFAKPASYDALIRFSNGPQQDDREPGPQGMAIKLIGVPGRKILEAEAAAGTHDFILIDGPVFFVRDTASYARLFKDLALRKQGAEPEKWLAELKRTHPQDVAVAQNYQSRIADSPLSRPFWSQVPYAFGPGDDTIARYSVVPDPENRIAPVPPHFRDKNCLRREMVEQLTAAGRPAGFDFFVQLRTDATPAIIDDPTVEWDTPVQKVAVITIPPQDFARPEQDRFAENLSYTPWHALPEHRPVGQINEIRRAVYAATSRVRHFFNLTAAREPTSAVTPRRTMSGTMRWAMAGIGALAVAGVAFFAVKVLPLLHVSLPEYPAVEKQVWASQNWPAGAREWYHHANQGGQFPPMINVPYEWFISLEQPIVSLGAAGLLADQRYLDRFGYIPSTTESGAYDWRRCAEPETGTGYESGKDLLAWRHRLPVGFTCSDRVADPMLHPDGKPWRNPATGRTMSAIGLTCAACHTGRFTYNKTEVLIDGGSAMTDVVKLNTAIALSLVFTKYDRFRFNRFALRLLGPDANDDSRAALREQLDAVAGRVRTLHELDQSVASRGVEEGFGRLDALNRIGNQVFSIDLGKPENYAGSSAPVHYPRIWDSAWFDWAQYNGSIGQPMVRNAGEALGTGAPIALAGSPPGSTALTAPPFTSTLQVGTLFRMEQMLAGKPPNEKDGFTGLRAPKWPADILGPLDQTLVERGARLYDDICAHCHMAPTRSAAFWNTPKHWTEANAAGERYLKVNLIPVEEVGTDRSHVDDLAARKVDIPPELNITSNSFAKALSEVVANAVNRWYDNQNPPVPEAKRQEMNGYRKNEVWAPLAYKARPLDGVWATPPYLHNGSVPTIDALLGPVADRPKEFWLGHREYDPVRLGYRFDKLSGAFEYDTSKRGNHNTGHEFDDAYKAGGPNRTGLIGPKLGPDDRKALIEFLKSL
jgi:hypothetical protein